ncbi:hypothetical protein FA13DRAFT_1279418 [Coprinellus micaceus]|uniref:Uncharacterized protein n=1 Tax=Coprinellus micaceus TaxID=71717 RepID=A0A4Y7SSQ6_COPMI|nr:hypothetical protein FA13DRAFT_1279418 [Coprinellus micaceus]
MSDRTQSSSHSHGRIRQDERSFGVPSHGSPHSLQVTPPVPSTFVYQPPSTAWSVSTSRTQSSRPGTGRSRTMDYPPSHVPSQQTPSPVLGHGTNNLQYLWCCTSRIWYS